jgi:ABC-type sugar transport system permease subunit
MRLSSVAWGFVAPAVLVIGVFFLLPVLTGLALSLTDFDIYALADLRNLRFVGLDNFAFAADRRCAGRLHALANAMAKKPSGFLAET